MHILLIISKIHDYFYTKNVLLMFIFLFWEISGWSFSNCQQKHLSHITRNPVYAICNNKCAGQPAHQHSLISPFAFHYLDSTMPLVSLSKISRLAGLCSWAGRFESYLVGNPKDRFSRDVAHFKNSFMIRVLITMISCLEPPNLIHLESRKFTT